MKYLFATLFLLSINNIYSQTTNNIKKVETLKIYGSNSKVYIGQLTINENSLRAKIYLDTIIQFRDTFSIWHTFITFRSTDTNPLFPAYLKFEFNRPYINFIWKFQGTAQTSQDSLKTSYIFLTQGIAFNPFTFLINSTSKEVINIEGTLGRYSDIKKN